jgi:hypothetical protein
MDDHAQRHTNNTARPNIIPPQNASTKAADAAIPAWRRYIHFYLPLTTAFLLFRTAPTLAALADSIYLRNDKAPNIILLVALFALPTYLIGSFFYPTNRPEPTPDQCVRFTRKSDIYRALVLVTYGRLYGTPFNLQFVIADLVMSYVAGEIIGERPAGTKQRRSEFFVALLWLGGSWVVFNNVPRSMETLYVLAGSADRTIWRTAYVALVDDVIGVLTRPDVKTVKGKIVLVLVQAFTITSLMYVALSMMRRYSLSLM